MCSTQNANSPFARNCRAEERFLSRALDTDARPLLDALREAAAPVLLDVFGEEADVCPSALLLAAGPGLVAEAMGLPHELAELLVSEFAEGVAEGWLELTA